MRKIAIFITSRTEVGENRTAVFHNQKIFMDFGKKLKDLKSSAILEKIYRFRKKSINFENKVHQL